MSKVQSIDLRAFDHSSFELKDVSSLYLVIKSLDQKERRDRLIAQLKNKDPGRMVARPVSEGLLLEFSAPFPASFYLENALARFSLQEPRGIEENEGDLLVSEMSRVKRFDPSFNEKEIYTHPFFSFLHSVQVHPDRDRFLVVSAGYDAIFEVDLKTHETVHEWFGWEHGFNPNDEGVFLTRSHSDHQVLQKHNVPSALIDPDRYDEQGLITGGRTTHPSIACYHPEDPSYILAVLGRGHGVCEIELSSGEWVPRVQNLEKMPHGIRFYQGHWIVTNTMKGEFWILDRDFELRAIYHFSSFQGKPPELGDIEWVQGVFPVNEEWQFIAADANRGLFALDLKEERYFQIPCDDNWCIQEVRAF